MRNFEGYPRPGLDCCVICYRSSRLCTKSRVRSIRFASPLPTIFPVKSFQRVCFRSVTGLLHLFLEQFPQHIKSSYGRVHAGLPAFVDGGVHASGQCRNVEREVRGLGTAVPRPAVLSKGLLARQLLERRIPNPEQRSALWQSDRASNVSLCGMDLFHIAKVRDSHRRCSEGALLEPACG